MIVWAILFGLSAVILGVGIKNHAPFLIIIPYGFLAGFSGSQILIQALS